VRRQDIEELVQGLPRGAPANGATLVAGIAAELQRFNPPEK